MKIVIVETSKMVVLHNFGYMENTNLHKIYFDENAIIQNIKIEIIYSGVNLDKITFVNCLFLDIDNVSFDAIKYSKKIDCVIIKGY